VHRSKEAIQMTAEIEGVQKLRDCRLVIRKTLGGALTRRMPSRRTLTAKLLNSNSFMGTNSRLGSSEEFVKNFIVVFKLV
jgi:hypothetical protein